MVPAATSILPPASGSVASRTRDRDSFRGRLLTAVLVLLVGGLLAGSWTTLAARFDAEWPSLLFWAILVSVSNLFPIAVDDLRLTIDVPLLIAVALLYPPPLAAATAFVGSLDARELRREVGPSRALYNRLQIALSVYLAGATFQHVAGDIEPWPLAVVGTFLAVAVDYVSNVGLVSVHAGARWGIGLQSALRRLTVGKFPQFLVTYLAYGLLALVLARLFRDVGAWSVGSFLVPTLIAQQMLVRGQRLEALSRELLTQERVLKKTLDRVFEERMDERHRIAADLHDEVIQSMTLISMLGKMIEAQATIPQVRELVVAAQRASDQLRVVIHDLKESPLGRGGLVQTLNSLIRDLRFSWKKRVDFRASVDVQLPRDIQLVAYQVAREGVLNSLKHANASRILVRVHQEGRGYLEIVVEDDGQGFVSAPADPAHFGLALIEERVRRVGGRVEINSRPGYGTKLRTTLPIPVGLS